MAVVIGSAETRPHTYVGEIVSANCMQAAQIVNRNSRGYTPPNGVNAFTGTRYKPLQTSGIRKSIMRHCPVNPGSTAFALLTDDGNFFKLDEAGNFEVIAQTSSRDKNVRVTITGFIDRETLNVKSLSKF
jgi:hypothetical protein